MNKYEGMSIEQVLQSRPVLQTSKLAELFRRSTRTLARWQITCLVPDMAVKKEDSYLIENCYLK